jgi:hypothetical protein
MPIARLCRLILLFSAMNAISLVARAELQITVLGDHYTPDPRRVAVAQPKANTGGNTSARNTDETHLEWKTQGYFQRNRDLGQVFSVEKPFRLDAIVLRTGPADAAVLAGAPGAKVFIQFFKVTGEPRINDNGTPMDAKATHGFSSNHRCDDFIDGVRYESIGVVKGGVFPDFPPTRDLEGKPTGNLSGAMQYMRWTLTGNDRLRFAAGQRYAFMVGFEVPGRERGFTLANANAAASAAAPRMDDGHDAYRGGWGLRREGDGTVPPTFVPGEAPPADEARRAELIGESLFATGNDRYSLSPTTDGYPDVDTYRDLNFFLEVQWTE